MVDARTSPFLSGFAFMESPNTSDFQERRVGPTVSKDKWINHAKTKLSKGYVLIVGKNKRTANFYLRSKGFEMCPHNVAKELIKEGIVVEDGEHPLGIIYKLAGDVTPIVQKSKPAPVDSEEPADELDDIIEDIDEGEEEDEEEPSAEDEG
jgi:hypothetical protein